MTFPRIYKPGHPKTFERDPGTKEFINMDTEATAEYQNRAMPTKDEIDDILSKADSLETNISSLEQKP